MTTNNEDKDPLDAPETPQEQQEEEKELVNDKDIDTESSNEEEEEEEEEEDAQEGNLPIAPSLLSLASAPSSTSFASPPVLNTTPYSYYNNAAVPYSASSSSSRAAISSSNASHFNRHNHAMLSSMKTFPEKLHQILDFAAANGMDDVISFFSHGGAFKVHKVGFY